MSPRRPRACGPRRGSRSITPPRRRRRTSSSTMSLVWDTRTIVRTISNATRMINPVATGQRSDDKAASERTFAGEEVLRSFRPRGALRKRGLSGSNECHRCVRRQFADPRPPCLEFGPLRLGGGHGSLCASLQHTVAALAEVPVDWAIWFPLMLVVVPDMAPSPLAHTYSIVARDPKTGELGVAVQSHYFSVGPVVPWAEAGVGAVATQSLVLVDYGPKGLDLMRAGMTAQQE